MLHSRRRGRWECVRAAAAGSSSRATVRRGTLDKAFRSSSLTNAEYNRMSIMEQEDIAIAIATTGRRIAG
jgi:hypothetical protein